MNFILIIWLKSIYLAQANPPNTNAGSSVTDNDDPENPRCEKCNRLLEINRVLIYNQPSATQPPMPRFSTTKRCVNRRCELYFRLPGRYEALEARPSATEANTFDLVPVVILRTRNSVENTTNDRNNSNFIPPIEE